MVALSHAPMAPAPTLTKGKGQGQKGDEFRYFISIMFLFLLTTNVLPFFYIGCNNKISPLNSMPTQHQDTGSNSQQTMIPVPGSDVEGDEGS